MNLTETERDIGGSMKEAGEEERHLAIECGRVCQP